MEFKPGDRIRLRRFAFINRSGGTGLSDWAHNERFQGEAEVEITKVWHDYEIGIRGWARPLSADLIAYTERNAARETVLGAPPGTVFWGQFDLQGAA